VILESGEGDGARLDFGGEMGIRGVDLCRVKSGFEEGVGDWDGNIRCEMHAGTRRRRRVRSGRK
jgi:hypothetical protein